MFAHAVARLRLDANGRLVETRAAALENALAVVESPFDVADRFEILIEPAAVGGTERALKVTHAFAGGVENAAVELDARLGRTQLVAIGRREQSFEDVAMIRGRGDIDT